MKKSTNTKIPTSVSFMIIQKQVENRAFTYIHNLDGKKQRCHTCFIIICIPTHLDLVEFTNFLENNIVTQYINMSDNKKIFFLRRTPDSCTQCINLQYGKQTTINIAKYKV